MKRLILIFLLIVNTVCAQDIPIETSLSRTCEIPMLIQQKDGSIVRTLHGYSGWIYPESNTVSDSTNKVKLGTIPDSCVVTEVKLFVVEGFNAGGTDALEVGYSMDHNALIDEPSITETGIHTEIEGDSVGVFIKKSHTIYAYYVGEGDAPTEGKAYIIIFWMQIRRNPL